MKSRERTISWAGSEIASIPSRRRDPFSDVSSRFSMRIYPRPERSIMVKRLFFPLRMGFVLPSPLTVIHAEGVPENEKVSISSSEDKV